MRYTNHISRPPSFRLAPALGSLPLPVARWSRLICWRVSKPCETAFRLCFGWAEEGMMVWAFSPRAYPMVAGTHGAARVGRVSPPSQVLGLDCAPIGVPHCEGPSIQGRLHPSIK